jgi:hypothetical protein
MAPLLIVVSFTLMVFVDIVQAPFYLPEIEFELAGTLFHSGLAVNL